MLKTNLINISKQGYLNAIVREVLRVKSNFFFKKVKMSTFYTSC